MKLGRKWGVGTLLGDPCIPHLQYWLRYYPHYHCLASFQAIPSSSFWWLAACKMEGESLEGVMCMTSGRYEGRYEGGWCPIIATHKPCVDQPRIYQITSCIDAVFRMLQSQAFGQDVTLCWAPPPPLMASCLPSCLPDVMHVTLSPRPFSPFLHTTSDQKL